MLKDMPAASKRYMLGCRSWQLLLHTVMISCSAAHKTVERVEA